MRQAAGHALGAARFSGGANGQRVLAVIRPIDNAPECSSAACHVHPAGQRVLGVIDAHLSLAPVDAQIAAHQAALALVSGRAAIVLGCLAAVLFMWVVVYRPVKELIDGTHRVAGGDLEYRLPVRSDDELGDLAASFNKMTAEVAGVQAKIEEQVRRKTAELERVSQDPAALGEDGLHRQAGGHGGARDQQSAVRHPDLRAAGAARRSASTTSRTATSWRSRLQTIERESKRCGDLVKNLLTFSRQAPSNREPNDLNTIVHRAVLLVKHKLDMQNIELREQLAEDLPPVECDANQIQQVALVLLVNASEAMAKGGALEVVDRVRRRRRNRRWCG